MRRLVVLLIALLSFTTAAAQSPNWPAVDAEALKTLQSYIRINTSVPPGDVTKAADLLAGILEREGIPVKRFESGPGRSIVLARLKGSGPSKPILLLHHMDVVPADASRWAKDPFGGEIADGKIWGRGAMDMKGPGVAHLFAFIMLKRQNVPLDRDILLMAVPDEEVGGGLGATWMREQHYSGARPRVHPRRRRLRQPRSLCARQAGLRYLGGREEADLAEAHRRGRRRPRLAAARQEPQRPARPRAGQAPRRADADGAVQRARHAQSARWCAGRQQVQQRDPAFDDRDHDAAGWGRRAAENQRHPVNRGSQSRLPCAAGDVEGAVAERDCSAARRSCNQDRRALRIAGSGRHDDGLGLLSRARGGGEEAASRRDCHADNRALRHRFERLSADSA